MRVIFIHGPAASGKHTIGSLVAARLGLPLFHNHLTVDLAKALFDFGSPGFNQLRADIWRAAFREAAAAGQSFVFTFHPEATVERSLIDELVSTVEAGQGRVEFVELKCSKATVLARIGNESRTKFGKLTDAPLYEQIESAGGFEFPALPPARVVVDTEQHSAEAAAGLIINALRQE